jgi:hypothetical protein
MTPSSSSAVPSRQLRFFMCWETRAWSSRVILPVSISWTPSVSLARFDSAKMGTPCCRTKLFSARSRLRRSEPWKPAL